MFRCPKVWAHNSLIMMCLNIGTPNNHHFSFGTNGKVVVLGVPILMHLGSRHSNRSASKKGSTLKYRWMDDLLFYLLFNSSSVKSGR